MIEAGLLAALQEAILRPAVVDRALRRFEEVLTKEIDKASGQADDVRKRKAALEGEIANLTRALADGYSSALTGELARRERELAELNAQLVSGGPGSVQATMKELRQKITTRLMDIRSLLSCDVAKARTQIARHVDKIVLRPVEKRGKRFYVAAGEWSLIGNEMGPDHEPAPVQLRMVAGARFERATFGL